MEHALTLIVDEEHCDPPVELNHDGSIRALTFSASGEYLWSASDKGLRMWRVEDGEEMARLEPQGGVECFAMSKDERWIAVGTILNTIVVWDARTCEKVFSVEGGRWGVDFSPDSSRLVSASTKGDFGDISWTIWDIATGKQVQTFHHEVARDNFKLPTIYAVKYSPQGDRIATAIEHSIRVWDSNDGRLLVRVNTSCKGLFWCDDHLFVASGHEIQQINASTGSQMSKWLVSYDHLPYMALPQHGGFIAYSTEHMVTFWDTATHTQLGRIYYPLGIGPIALSPDNRFLATGSRRRDGKIIIKSLPHVAVSIRLIFHCGVS